MAERDEPAVDRSQMDVVRLDEAEELDRRYWLTRTPLERWEAMERIRQVIYGYDPATARLQRVLEIVERK